MVPELLLPLLHGLGCVILNVPLMQDKANFPKLVGGHALYPEKNRVLWQRVKKEFNTYAKVSQIESLLEKGNTPQIECGILSEAESERGQWERQE